MKDIFMTVLRNLTVMGDLKEATMYEGGKWATMTIETTEGTYSISIRKTDEE
jgi:hypothetical protein